MSGRNPWPPPGAPKKKHFDKECDTCVDWREKYGDFFPSHDASALCESGGRNHCTCPICWG